MLPSNVRNFALTFLLGTAVSFSASFAAEESPELRRMLNDIKRMSNIHDWERAAPVADAALKKYPNSYDVRVAHGLVYLGLEEEDKAIADFEWALKRNPKDWNVSNYLSDVYTQIGKDDLALKYIDMSIAARKIPIQRPDGYMKRKDILKHLKRYEEAEKSIDLALQDVDSPHWHFERLKLRIQNQHWQTAIDEANYCLVKLPQLRRRIIFLREQAYAGLKRFAAAERDLNELLTAAPRSKKFHQQKLRLLQLEGKKDLALKEQATINSLGDEIDLDDLK